MTSQELYVKYREKMQRIADVRNASGVLQWDQETYLPPKGAGLRGQQISTLMEITHRMSSEEELGSLMQELLQKNDLSPAQRRNVERSLEDYERRRKYPPEFVRLLSDQVNKAFHSWIEARKNNDFRIYELNLTGLVKLKQEEAALLDFGGHPYNALLDEYEKGATIEMIDSLFANLLPTLQDIARKIATAGPADDSFLNAHFPRQQQWDWGMYLIKELNFDLEAGRQDMSEHPFSISFNNHDVRITTRIAENDFANMTWSCIHEVGHGLYEQGLPEEQYGLPLGEACSYSIHESQSRLWENNVGRGLNFWKHYYPILQERFPQQFGGVALEKFYKGINKVQPSLVRTEADEITYHFHVFIRYELEKKLIEGSLSAADIPAYWKEQYKKWLDVDVPDDRSGSLQDVHWSHGSFGYFPTYSLGSLYAAQFYAEACRQMPGLEAQIAAGNTGEMLMWLRAKIHQTGRFHTSEDLCREVTGKPLDAGYFLQYLLDKYGSMYTLS
jgi:carboxypeptidase Taq